MVIENDLERLLFHSTYLKQKDYWTRKLSAQREEAADIPMDSQQYRGEASERGDTPTSVKGDRYEIPFCDELSQRILNMCKHADLALYIFLLSALKTLIHRYTNHKDMMIISPIHGGKATKDTINSLVLIRHYVDGAMTFKELVLNLRSTVLEAYENQDYPYEKLAEFFFPSSSPTHISCCLENIHRQRDIKEIKARLSFCFSAGREKLEGHVLYDRSFYRENEIHRIIDHFLLLLTRIGENIETRISNIDFLTVEEKNQLLKDFNDNKVDFSRDKTLMHWYEEQTEKTPDAVATACNHHQVTYIELNQRANRLANRLKTYHIRGDQTLGILLQRSQPMVESIMATWKVGGAYIPLEIDDPPQRHQEILADSAAAVLLSQAQWVSPQLEKTYNGNLLLLNEHPKETHLANRADANLNLHPGNLAYVIYTSGSTGKPKGAMVEHIGMMNHIQAKIHDLQITAKSIAAQNASHTFDISVWQFFTALIRGGKTVIYPDQVVLEPNRFITRVTADQVSVLEVVPAYLSVMLEFLDTGTRYFDTLQYLLVTGETIKPGLVRRWFDKYPAVKMMNAYGPTEASDDITHFIIEKAPDMTRVPIGKPVRNLSVYILDEYMNLCPLGVIGEICVSGIGVGRGYLNNPELTARGFINYYRSHKSYMSYLCKTSVIHAIMQSCHHAAMQSRSHAIMQPAPLHPHHSPLTIYRTGDLARWLPDGTIEFFGRKDYQVKIHGFRIEPGEIENRLANLPGIKEVVVMDRGEKTGDKYLCAYFVSDRQYETPGLRENLSKELPDYMIPSYFVRLEKIPLTPNGKIDREALPEPGLNVGVSYTAPGNEIEKKLAALWSEILGRSELHTSQLKTSIGIDDNFFEWGGNSLKATILVAKIHKEFDVNVPLAEIFKTPRIKELAKYIKDKRKDYYITIDPVEEKKYYELSSAQKRLYSLQQINSDSTAYNISGVIPLWGGFDLGKINEIFKKLIKRHESLRTSFHLVNDTPVQKIHEHVEFEIEYDRSLVNDKGRSEASWPINVENIIRNFIRPFDLSKAPLLRAGLLKTIEEKYLLLADMHHIISDGISQDILANDFLALHERKELHPLRIRYKDFSERQKAEKEKEKLESQKKYWMKEFEGEIPVLELPVDYPRPVVKSFEGDSLNFEITAEETRALKAMALSENSTLFMVLVAFYNILLSKLSGQEEIIMGTPTAGRRHADLENIIGMFVNTLALRNYPAGDRTFGEFLGDVKERMLMVFENQEYPFEELVDKLSVTRDIGRNPLFEVMFVMQNMNTGLADQEKDTGMENSRLFKFGAPFEYENIFRTAKFDLTLTAAEIDRGVLFSFRYCTKIFKKETIERFIIYFKKIVSIAVKKPGIRIRDIEIVSGVEKKQILKNFNKTESVYPKDKTISQLFAEQVKRIPNHIVTVGAAPPNCPAHGQYQITYRELNNRSNHIASLLRTKGVKPGAIVAVMVKPTLEMVVGIVGILKAGCVFLPLEPEAPRERINFLLNDGSVTILLTQSHLPGAVKKNIELINLEEGALYTRESKNVISEAAPVSSVYVIYTSGTTGSPKGVLINNNNLVNYAYWFIKTIRLTAADRAVLTSSFAFDALYTQFFSSLFTGSQLHVIPRETFLFPERLINYLRKNKITYIKVTPSLFNLIVNSHEFSSEMLSTLRFVMLGGEAINVNDVEKAHKLCPHLQMMNHYGPTETTIGSIARFLDFDKFTEYKVAPTIGKPLYNTRVFILDKYFNMAPVGVVGGLYIAGDGVGMGYLNKPELTGEKFIFSRSNRSYMTYIPKRLYSTGDIARWYGDGNIEFLGRLDSQVKIHGIRIELGEIEYQILKHPKIKEALAIIHEVDDLDKQLCLYYVEKEKINGPHLREYLLQILPPHMIPSFFVRLEKIPLTLHGKIDRKALPGPIRDNAMLENGFKEPTTEMETILVDHWKKILNLEKVGINDNFFGLGGNSLAIMRLNAKLKEDLGRDIPIVKMFQYTTIHSLSRYLSEEGNQLSTAADEPVNSLPKGGLLMDAMQKLRISKNE